jgi:hypothetical protein
MTFLGRFLRTLGVVPTEPGRRAESFNFVTIAEASFLSGAIALGPEPLAGTRVRHGGARF